MRLLVLFVLFAISFGVHPAQAEQLRPQLDDMVRHFGQVVFGDEYGLNTGEKVIAKWQGPVGVTIQGRPTKPMAKMASRRLSDLSKLTKLKFKQVKPGTPGQNIDLLFLKRQEMGLLKGQNLDQNVIRRLTADPTMVCFFLTWKKPQNRIVKAIVVVNVERDPVQINACLLEELTQVMGLPNDVDAYWPSMFNNLDMSLSWSQWDELYLKTLYDPRIKPGMKPVDALFIAKGIFAEALANQP
ncbi:MAG: DUF2927 domain-containing protein [Magnetovibrio sp.]|nr:DUF2927 domain-containing protein [Magnetovibrio sp.]